MKQTKNKIAIIGAGISGLSFAYYCQKHHIDFTLFEKNSYLGGCIQSVTHNGATIELGAHTLYRSYDQTVALIEELGLEKKIIPTPKHPYKILENSVFSSIFSNFNFIDLVRYTLNPFNKSALKKPSTKEKFSRLFGPKNYQNLIRPFFSALLNQDPDLFPAKLLFKKRNKKKQGPKKFNLEGGLQTLIDKLAEKSKKKIKLNFDATKWFQDTAGLYYLDGDTDKYKAVVFATPLNTTIKCLESLLNEPCLLDKSPHSKNSFALAMATEKPTRWPSIAGAITKKAPFRSFICFYDSKNSMQGLCAHFKEDPLQKADAFRHFLHLPSKQDIKVVKTKTNTMPILTVEKSEKLMEISASIKNKGIFLIGNSYQGVAVEDCILRSQSQVEPLKEFLSIDE